MHESRDCAARLMNRYPLYTAVPFRDAVVRVSSAVIVSSSCRQL